MAVIIGLTGGIASGKSTVSKMLTDLGFPVIDADQIAHKVVEVGEPAYQEIVSTFGKDILLPNLTIDRPKLGGIIFNDPQLRHKLNSIVHPAVRKEMLKQADYYVEEGEKAIFLDIPLLFESKLTYMVEKTLLVYVDSNVQLDRLMARNSLTEDEAKARITSQLPLDEKVALADAVIDNNGSIEKTKDQLISLLKEWNLL